MALVGLGPWVSCSVTLPPGNACLFLAPRDAIRVQPTGSHFAYPFFAIWDGGMIGIVVDAHTIIACGHDLRLAIKGFNTSRDLATSSLSE